MDLNIEVTPEAQAAHERVNKKQGKYAIFKADDKKTSVLLDSEGGLDATFDEFRDAIPDNEPRYVFPSSDGV